MTDSKTMGGETLAALKQCQQVLAALTAGELPTSTLHLWAQCVEAETVARRVIAKAEGRNPPDSLRVDGSGE
jgi:NADPH-dependent ferric siderophore reductase